ncbi:MAG: ABC transporter ATP-binding protein [Deltaproteobacteria bacterium]|nr:ABC transporter ATP-binding protein [Deltaproteobacteria bacterium]
MGATLGILALMASGAFLEMVTLGMGVPLLEAATRSEQASQNRIIIAVKSLLGFFGFSTNNNIVLFSLLIVVSGVVVLNGAVVLLKHYGGAFVAKNLHREVKSKLFQKTLSAQYSYLEEKGRGALLYNISAPALSIFQVMTYSAILVSSILNILGVAVLMVYLSWWATLGVGTLGFGWVYIWRRMADRRAARFGRELYALESQTNKIEVDAIDGLKVVKSNELIAPLAKKQELLLWAQLKPHLKSVLLIHGVSFANDILACGIVITLGGLALGLGWGQMPFAKLVIFFVALRKAAPLLASINSSYAQLNRDRKSIEVIDEILHMVPEERFGDKILKERVFEIAFDNVRFHYSSKPEKTVLKGVNLVLKRGEITALVGSTGSGKSTAANLLVGLYRPMSGQILVNGKDLSSLDLNRWREKIGYVSQDVFLFHDTIRENISLWNPSVRPENIESACRLAQLHDFIVTLPEGYDTIVGDRGLRLSGGQAQRVAIARAILKQPDILIFDEATSALDNLTEKAIYEAIHSLRKEAVVLVIAHRLSTIQDVDQICVLKQGEIVEEGNHRSLIALNGIYSRLYHGGEVRHVPSN